MQLILIYLNRKLAVDESKINLEVIIDFCTIRFIVEI